MNSIDQKEIPEYVIKKILDGMVFFIAEESLIEFFEMGDSQKFERFGKEVKIRGFEGVHKLYFIKNDERFKQRARALVIGAGANFEALIGIFFEYNSQVPACHVYCIGSRFDLDRLNDMVYSLFTESGEYKIKEKCRRAVFFDDK